MTHDCSHVRYSLSTPHQPVRRFLFNLGTKQAQLLGEDRFKNLSEHRNLGEQHCELLKEVEMRDGFKIPMVLKYDKRFYNDDSPWVFFTQGAES